MFYKGPLLQGPLALGGESGKLHYHAMAKVPKERRRDFRELAHQYWVKEERQFLNDQVREKFK